MGKLIVLEVTINLMFQVLGNTVIDSIVANGTVKETEDGIKYILLNKGYEINRS